MMLSILPCACWLFVYLWRCLYSSPSPIFKLDYLFVVELYDFIIALNMKSIIDNMFTVPLNIKSCKPGSTPVQWLGEVVTGADTCFMLVLHRARMVLLHLHSCVTVALGGPGSQQHQATQLGSGRARCGRGREEGGALRCWGNGEVSCHRMQCAECRARGVRPTEHPACYQGSCSVVRFGLFLFLLFCIFRNEHCFTK